MPHFTYVKRGFDPDEVQKHIDLLQAELREYREKDASITNAILSAQLAADEIIRKADVAADTIIKNARNMAARLSEISADQIVSIIAAVKDQRGMISDFKDDYTALLNKYIHAIDESAVVLAEKKAAELEGYLQKFVDTELSALDPLAKASALTEDDKLAEQKISDDNQDGGA